MKIRLVGDRLHVWTGFAARKMMGEIPGGRWNAKERCRVFAANYPTMLALDYTAKKLGEALDVDPDTGKWAFAEAAAWQSLAGLAANLGEGGPSVDGLYPHQLAAAEWLHAPGVFGGRLDASETGSGKTASALRAAWDCWQAGERGILLVSTLMSVKQGWVKEVNRLSEHLPIDGDGGWQVFTVPNSGTVDKRRKVIAAAVEANTEAGGVGVVLVVNHEQLRTHSRLAGWGDIALRRCKACGGAADVVSEAKCQAHDRELNKIPFVAAVFDECHRMMAPTAQTTRAAWAVADATPRVWGLTGTPGSRLVMENTWALLRLVAGSDWPSKSAWTGYYAQTGYDALGFWTVGDVKPEHSGEFYKVYDTMVRRALKDQVLSLPPLLRGGTLEREIPMKGEQLAVYKSMRDQLWLQVDEGVVTAQNILVQIGRLTALANATGVPGPNYGKLLRVEADGKEVYDAHMDLRAPSNKLDAVVDMIAHGDITGPCVFQFVHPELIYMLRDLLVHRKLIGKAQDFGIIAGPESEAARTIALDRFQSGKSPFIGFTVGAGGTGITLTAAPVMVAVERPWSPIQWKQAQDRVHRIGSEVHQTVSIIDLVTPDSVEVDQLARFAENAEALELVVRDKDRLRELLY